MSMASHALVPAQRHDRFRRLVVAELLKLRRRRALLGASLALTVAPMVVSYVVLAILHAANGAKYGPAGGVENLRGALQLLTQIGAVAAVLIGVNAGGGDLAAGVFRELVVTGRSRLALFAARIPGGLAFLLALVAVAFVIAAAASVALAASGEAPGAALLVEYAAWVGLVLTVGFLLALGVSSLLGSRSTSIGVLLAWQLAVAPLLLQSGRLDAVLVGAALRRIEPGGESVAISPVTAILLIIVWTVVPLAAGAWRTQTRDA
jgi:ABC-type transport system involved in multi-copper enzyme maturation permease subunit